MKTLAVLLCVLIVGTAYGAELNFNIVGSAPIKTTPITIPKLVGAPTAKREVKKEEVVVTQRPAPPAGEGWQWDDNTKTWWRYEQQGYNPLAFQPQQVVTPLYQKVCTSNGCYWVRIR